MTRYTEQTFNRRVQNGYLEVMIEQVYRTHDGRVVEVRNTRTNERYMVEVITR